MGQRLRKQNNMIRQAPAMDAITTVRAELCYGYCPCTHHVCKKQLCYKFVYIFWNDFVFVFTLVIVVFLWGQHRLCRKWAERLCIGAEIVKVIHFRPPTEKQGLKYVCTSRCVCPVVHFFLFANLIILSIILALLAD